MTLRFAMFALVANLASCKRAPAPTLAATDAGARFDRPADHLGKDELVPAQETMLGMPMPRDFRVVDQRAGEITAKGEATLEELRRHVLEHTSNAVAKPEGDVLVWWDAEIPGRGATRFTVRAWRSGGGAGYLLVREQAPLVVIDGGTGEVLRALGLDDKGYPTDYDRLR